MRNQFDCRRANAHVRAFARALDMDLRGRSIRMTDFWVNIMPPTAAHSLHLHPLSFISGTYYVATPPGASALKLEDPRLPMMMAAPGRTREAPEDLQTFVYVAPAPGTVLMWESWLRHEVLVNAAKSERISISFNYV